MAEGKDKVRIKVKSVGHKTDEGCQQMDRNG